MGKSLIAFYSRADENYFGGSMKMLTVGNTEVAARILQELTGADMFKIEQKVPYDRSYDRCIRQAKEDKNKNARPELVNTLDSIADYDVIYLGYPNYWGTVPMAVCTFLESLDFSGKVIAPFCTHEGSGLANTPDNIKSAVPDARIIDGLAIRGRRADKEAESIQSWAENVERTARK